MEEDYNVAVAGMVEAVYSAPTSQHSEPGGLLGKDCFAVAMIGVPEEAIAEHDGYSRWHIQEFLAVIGFLEVLRS